MLICFVFRDINANLCNFFCGQCKMLDYPPLTFDKHTYLMLLPK